MQTALRIESPLRTDRCGAIRIGGTRITLDTVIGAYKRGDSPEEILEGFPALDLADIYATIAYYLSHRDEVEAYLAEGEAGGERHLRKLEQLRPTDGLRERLRKVRDER